MLRSLAADLEITLPAQAETCTDPDEALAMILEAARSHAGEAGDFTISHLTHRYQVFRANSKALARFHATPLAIDTLLCHVSTLAEETRTAWFAATGGHLTIVSLEGSHHTILHRPRVIQLAKRLKKWITTIK
jgi:thioesterase domain-containing protein